MQQKINKMRHVYGDMLKDDDEEGGIEESVAFKIKKILRRKKVFIPIIITFILIAASIFWLLFLKKPSKKIK